MESVAAEARKLNPSIKTEVVRLDVSSAAPSDYGALFKDNERTSIVVNNAGIMQNRYFLTQDPAKMEMMIKTNVHPFVYMSKYALLHFRSNADKHDHKNAMLYTSSMAAFCWMSNTALYSATKAHNFYLAKQVSKAAKKSSRT